MQKPEDFIADVARDLSIIEAISQTVFALDLAHLVEVEVDGTDDASDFPCEIDGLQRRLRLSGAADDE